MLGLSPIRLLIIVVVALIVFGPDKLPEFARQAGAAWKTLRSLQERVESEIRQTVPDLPKTSDIARYARSPISLLNQLADKAVDEEEARHRAERGEEAPAPLVDGGAAYSAAAEGPVVRDPDRPSVAWGDPSLN